jgi:DNA-binding NarL/FixJ family response regulator
MREMPGGWVLIVEDDAVLALATARLLRSEGLANVVVVGTAREARVRARRRGLVAANVDVGLPDANGIDVAVALRELHPHAEIATWSANDDMTVVRAANAAGFEFITKVAATEVLRRRARRWAHLREQVSPRVLTVSERFLEVRRRYTLTDQQAKALHLALEQRTCTEIAAALGVTKKAIEGLSSRVARCTGRSLAAWTRTMRVDLHELQRATRDGRSTGVRARDDGGKPAARRRA